MFKQRWLEFIETERLERLWEAFPEPARRDVTQHYARLMARKTVQRIQALKKKQEAGDESNAC